MFINTGRGGSVVEADLVTALEKGYLSACGLDVLESENPDLQKLALLGRDNVIITPHTAFFSAQAAKDLQDISCNSVIAALTGRYDDIDLIINRSALKIWKDGWNDMVNRQAILDEKLLGPAHGPYSQAFLCGPFFFSGVIGSTAEKDPVSDSVYEQTIQIFKNTQALLEKAGGSLEDIVKVTVYLLDMSDFEKMNRAYKEMLKHKPLPARATVAVKEMLPGIRVEMEITAYID